MKELNVALIQMHCKAGDLEHNLNVSNDLMLDSISKGARILCLSELFDSGYALKCDKDFALNFKKSNRTLKFLLDFAKNYNVFIIANSIEKSAKHFYDTAYIVAPSGILGKYRKIYLWGSEKSRFKNGRKYPVFKLDLGDFKLKIGLQICYEIGFGEGARILALKGAEIIFYPSAFGRARFYAWDVASRARALENGVFVIACNQSGNEILEFGGKSRIINPKGQILCEAKQENEILIANIHLDEVKQARNEIPYLKDLNKKLVIKNLKKLVKSAKKEDLKSKT